MHAALSFNFTFENRPSCAEGGGNISSECKFVALSTLEQKSLSAQVDSKSGVERVRAGCRLGTTNYLSGLEGLEFEWKDVLRDIQDYGSL